MNKQSAEGRTNRAKGAIKEMGGKLTGNRRTQAEGKAQKLAGKAQSTVGRAKDEIQANRYRAEHSPRAR